MHLTRSPRYDRRQALQLTAMVEVPREPEAVRGEVEVPDLVGEHGGVALLPRRDGQVVARRVVAQRDVLHPGQFLCGCYITGWRHSRHLLYFEIFGAMGRVDLLIQNWFHRKSKGRQCKGRWPRNFDFFS